MENQLLSPSKRRLSSDFPLLQLTLSDVQKRSVPRLNPRVPNLLGMFWGKIWSQFLAAKCSWRQGLLPWGELNPGLGTELLLPTFLL